MVGLRGVGVTPGVVRVVDECRYERGVRAEVEVRVWVWECVCG